MRNSYIALAALLLMLPKIGLAQQPSNADSPQPEVTTSIPRPPNEGQTNHVRLSTPVVKAWRKIPVGSPIYALDEVVKRKNWLELAQIQLEESWPSGRGLIMPEFGYTIFRIYPYLPKDSPQPSIYQGIKVKVKGTLSAEELLSAIRNRVSTVTIDEYQIFGTRRVSCQRYSRPHPDFFKIQLMNTCSKSDASSQTQRRIPNEAPADSANERQANVLEAVLRYQISEMSSASYCVQVNGKDAKKDFLVKLKPAPVKKASSCRSQRYSSNLPMDWIVDKQTKKPAVLLHVGQLRFLDATHAEVEGGYDCGELCMGVGIYRVEYDGESWRVVEFRIEVQS